MASIWGCLLDLDIESSVIVGKTFLRELFTENLQVAREKKWRTLAILIFRSNRYRNQYIVEVTRLYCSSQDIELRCWMVTLKKLIQKRFISPLSQINCRLWFGKSFRWKNVPRMVWFYNNWTSEGMSALVWVWDWDWLSPIFMNNIFAIDFFTTRRFKFLRVVYVLTLKRI